MGSTLAKREEELEFYSKHEDSVYGKGELYTSLKYPCSYIIKLKRLLLSPHQYQLYSTIEDTQNVYLIGLCGYIFGKSCECS